MSGGTPDRSNRTYWQGTIPWISAFTLKTTEIFTSDQFVSAQAVKAGSKMAPINSTLLLVRGSALHKEIRAGLVTAPVAFNQDVKALVPLSGLEPKYLTFSILGNSEKLLRLVTSAGNTAGVLDTKVVQDFEIWVPGNPEQRQIITKLNDADSLVASLERLVAKKQSVKQGMMQQLLTGRRRLPGFTHSWFDDASIEQVATLTMGQAPRGASYNTKGNGLPLIQGNADIRDRRSIDRLWTTEPSKLCRVDDVLLTVRAPVGFTAIASRASCIGRGVCALSTPNSNRFLYHALVHAEPRWSVFEQGSTFTAVNSAEVKAFTFPWPSDLNERNAIAAVLDDADDEIARLKDRLQKATDIKQGMMQELLTGRTRLQPVSESLL
ncbi:restriction endonuclease subunit S [Pseudarthrobacter sp. L1SW]|uniref:restriction endonuclease subunit S n=1 Tax=Pseudarthrobacter sp. L1SW TaxID=2851598 RepID=UPI002106D74E|nr:restriction endonuclease subunit S [Pseudarthrobacter sp. L1SW]